MVQPRNPLFGDPSVGLVVLPQCSCFLDIKLALPALRESARQRDPQSVVGRRAGRPSGHPLYLMIKGGVTLFTKSAALEFARNRYRIRVNSIHPGTTETDTGTRC